LINYSNSDFDVQSRTLGGIFNAVIWFSFGKQQEGVSDLLQPWELTYVV